MVGVGAQPEAADDGTRRAGIRTAAAARRSPRPRRGSCRGGRARRGRSRREPSRASGRSRPSRCARTARPRRRRRRRPARTRPRARPRRWRSCLPHRPFRESGRVRSMPKAAATEVGEHLRPALGEVEPAGRRSTPRTPRTRPSSCRRRPPTRAGSRPSTRRPSGPSRPASSSASRAARCARARPRTRTCGTSSPHTASSTRQATSSAWPSAARSGQCRTAVRPSRMPCQVASTSPPSALTAPVPVTTTGARAAHGAPHERGLEEVGDGIHRGQARPRVVGHGDAEPVLQPRDELEHGERVDLQVEAEVGGGVGVRRHVGCRDGELLTDVGQDLRAVHDASSRGWGWGWCAASAAGASRRGAVGSPSSR